MKNTEVSTLTKVGNAILSAEAINTLENWQDDSNGSIRDYIESLADAVCFFGKTKMHFDKDFLEEAESLMERLSFIRSDLKYLKKP